MFLTRSLIPAFHVCSTAPSLAPSALHHALSVVFICLLLLTTHPRTSQLSSACWCILCILLSLLFLPYLFKCYDTQQRSKRSVHPVLLWVPCCTIWVVHHSWRLFSLLPGTVTYAGLFSLEEFTFLFKWAKPYWLMCWLLSTEASFPIFSPCICSSSCLKSAWSLKSPHSFANRFIVESILLARCLTQSLWVAPQHE